MSDGPSSEGEADLEALLSEYRAVVAKVDAAANAIFERRADDIACAKGCAQCCAPGLTVLGVEAVSIEAHLSAHGLSAPPAPAGPGCAFLDAEGACTIYPARPLLCRTHGLALRMKSEVGEARPGLRVLADDDGVSVCELNFTQAAPAAEDVLDAETIQALLTTVDARFREVVDLGDADRIPLEAIARAFAEGA